MGWMMNDLMGSDGMDELRSTLLISVQNLINNVGPRVTLSIPWIKLMKGPQVPIKFNLVQDLTSNVQPRVILSIPG
ncbi:hypothetical protein CEXT_541211 [Caerostris extrusa]|uniref:Uncharacterized protein n=1 Tax=Caerostris extrusa TaxID=172846 RepID=A0AAV4XNC8_CAEEX|nr:hypothetical protein CEXT_541211 [Caerostris extrusa]